jgi:hypothetical protein
VAWEKRFWVALREWRLETSMDSDGNLFITDERWALICGRFWMPGFDEK